DIVVRVLAEKHDPKTATVRDAMTPGVEYCFEDEDVQAAARRMEEKQIRRLVILNRNKRLVGIVSLRDLAVHTKNIRLSGEVLEGVSEPAKPSRSPA
ncbi:MAG: CBS domain-containing protein, partial [Nitrospiraceae bacterium]